MTLPRLEAISKRWAVIPPLSVSAAQIAAVLGVKHESKSAPKKQEQDLSELQSLVGQGFSTEKPEWLTK